MSIDEATPEDWDAVKNFKFETTGPDFKREDFECLLPANHRKVMDAVEKPPHYRHGEVEAIDYIEQQLGTGVKDYLLGNVHKYLHRHRFKGQLVEDLRKCRWYLDRLIYEEVQGGLDG